MFFLPLTRKLKSSDIDRIHLIILNHRFIGVVGFRYVKLVRKSSSFLQAEQIPILLVIYFFVFTCYNESKCDNKGVSTYASIRLQQYPR